MLLRPLVSRPQHSRQFYSAEQLMFLLSRLDPSTALRIASRILRMERKYPPTWIHKVRAIALEALGRPHQAIAVWQSLLEEKIEGSQAEANILATIRRLQETLR